MRVKVGNRWYDSDQQPICIQVSELEQQQIADMDRRGARQGKYAIFPPGDGMSVSEKIEWMGAGDAVFVEVAPVVAPGEG